MAKILIVLSCRDETLLCTDTLQRNRAEMRLLASDATIRATRAGDMRVGVQQVSLSELRPSDLKVESKASACKPTPFNTGSEKRCVITHVGLTRPAVDWVETACDALKGEVQHSV